jgi:hypothetical protein
MGGEDAAALHRHQQTAALERPPDPLTAERAEVAAKVRLPRADAETVTGALASALRLDECDAQLAGPAGERDPPPAEVPGELDVLQPAPQRRARVDSLRSAERLANLFRVEPDPTPAPWRMRSLRMGEARAAAATAAAAARQTASALLMRDSSSR